MALGYVPQLLPDKLQAEVLRDALWLYTTGERTEAQLDAAHALLAKLADDMHRNRKP